MIRSKSVVLLQLFQPRDAMYSPVSQEDSADVLGTKNNGAELNPNSSQYTRFLPSQAGVSTTLEDCSCLCESTAQKLLECLPCRTAKRKEVHLSVESQRHIYHC